MEGIEDEWQFLLRDSGAFITYRYHNTFLAALAGKGDGSAHGRKLDGIVQKVGENPAQLSRIPFDDREILVALQAKPEPQVNRFGLVCLIELEEELVDGGGTQVEGEPAGLEPREFEKIFNKSLQLAGFILNDFQVFLSCVRVETISLFPQAQDKPPHDAQG
jgi:hypothetical protein